MSTVIAVLWLVTGAAMLAAYAAVSGSMPRQFFHGPSLFRVLVIFATGLVMIASLVWFVCDMRILDTPIHVLASSLLALSWWPVLISAFRARHQ